MHVAVESPFLLLVVSMGTPEIRSFSIINVADEKRISSATRIVIEARSKSDKESGMLSCEFARFIV